MSIREELMNPLNWRFGGGSVSTDRMGPVLDIAVRIPVDAGVGAQTLQMEVQAFLAELKNADALSRQRDRIKDALRPVAKALNLSDDNPEYVAEKLLVRLAELSLTRGAAVK